MRTESDQLRIGKKLEEMEHMLREEMAELGVVSTDQVIIAFTEPMGDRDELTSCVASASGKMNIIELLASEEHST